MKWCSTPGARTQLYVPSSNACANLPCTTQVHYASGAGRCSWVNYPCLSSIQFSIGICQYTMWASFPLISLLLCEPHKLNTSRKATSCLLFCFALQFGFSFSFSSLQFSRPVVCDSLWPLNRSMPGLPVYHQLPEFTQTRPSSRWCHPAISSSVVPFSSCPQSFSESESIPMSPLFAWGGQSIGASASVLPKKSQDWSPLEQTAWISLQSKGLSSPSAYFSLGWATSPSSCPLWVTHR